MADQAPGVQLVLKRAQHLPARSVKAKHHASRAVEAPVATGWWLHPYSGVDGACTGDPTHMVPQGASPARKVRVEAAESARGGRAGRARA